MNLSDPQPDLNGTTAEIRLREPAPPETGCTGRPGPVCRRCVPWLVRNRRLVLWLALIVSAAGAWFSVKLYSDLRSNIEELLPDNAPSVVAARTLGPKLHSGAHLAVVFEGKDGDALDRLADDLVARLRKLPPDLIEFVEYRTDAQEAFLRRFGGIYLSVPELESIQQRIDKRVAWEKRKNNPLLNILGGEEDLGPAPALDFSDIEAKYGAVNGALSQFRKGYFQTPDGRLLVILVRPPESATGLEANRRLLDTVRAEVEALRPPTYDPSIQVGYASEVAALVEEQAALVGDLALSTTIVLALVLLVLWIYFRRWTAILAISGALAAGCALTFGASHFLVGHLNANTAFLGSIVVGNGINVSIIFVARYLEERRLQKSIEEAMKITWSGTLAATFVASFAAGLAYLSLSVTGFRGFSQFGVIGGLGMALCWVTAYLLLPPLISAFDSRSKRGMAQPHRTIVSGAVSRLNVRAGGAVRACSLALLVAAVFGVLTYRGGLIEHDPSELRSAKSARSGAQFWTRKMDQVFQAYLTPIVVRADTPGDLQRLVEEIDRARAALGSRDPLREVRTLETAVPPDQEEKLPLLARIRESLRDTRLEKISPDQRRKALDLRPPQNLRPVTIADLPETIRLPLTERDGTVGLVALAFPRKVGTLDARDIAEITDLIRGAIERTGGHAQAVGQSLLFADIASAITRDGPRATLLALSLVCLLVLVVFRRLAPTVQVIGSLLLGVAWLVGAAAFMHVRVNFLNFIVLPITFGIGVDYAVNIVQRWRLEGQGSLKRVLEETGGAVALCSATTIIGYASLLVADNRALRGFGLLASLGEVTCIAAALVALPSWLLRRKATPPKS